VIRYATIYRKWDPDAESVASCSSNNVRLYAGTRYSPAELVARLTLAWSAKVIITIDDTTGKVVLTPALGQSYTIEWGSTELRDYLGFASGLIDQTKATGDYPVRGWYRAAIAAPWGAANSSWQSEDNVNWDGRIHQSDPCAVQTTGSIRLWVRRKEDVATLGAALSALYSAADEWVGGLCVLVTDAGESEHCIADGWECAPELLDQGTALIQVETMTWRA
jgi:hypothetical protein